MRSMQLANVKQEFRLHQAYLEHKLESHKPQNWKASEALITGVIPPYSNCYQNGLYRSYKNPLNKAPFKDSYWEGE